jgi:hypothetical protein
MANKEKEDRYIRVGKDMTPDKIQGFLNEKFDEGYSILYYDERIMAVDNVWVTVVFEKIKQKKSFL